MKLRPATNNYNLHELLIGQDAKQKRHKLRFNASKKENIMTLFT